MYADLPMRSVSLSSLVWMLRLFCTIIPLLMLIVEFLNGALFVVNYAAVFNADILAGYDVVIVTIGATVIVIVLFISDNDGDDIIVAVVVAKLMRHICMQSSRCCYGGSCRSYGREKRQQCDPCRHVPIFMQL
jgi:hypothetical protein